ncbi:MAG: DUF935 family protein, partial [Bacteroidales bacterium]
MSALFFMVGKYNSADKDSRRHLNNNMGPIGGNTRISIPNEAELDIYYNQSSGSNNLYTYLRAACNEKILITVSGETMTTLSGSSHSQAEVHKDTKEGGTPNGWNCKCSVKPTRKGVTAVPDGDDSPTEIPLPLRNNPGTSGKLI